MELKSVNDVFDEIRSGEMSLEEFDAWVYRVEQNADIVASEEISAGESMITTLIGRN